MSVGGRRLQLVFLLLLLLLTAMSWRGEVNAAVLRLTWADHADNEDGFKIERKTEAIGSFAQIAVVGTDSNAYTDAGLAVGTIYCYRVRAFNIAGDSAYSNEACGTPTGQSLILSLNQRGFRPGDTLLVGLEAGNEGAALVADFYMGVLPPDGVTVGFITSLSPLAGIVTPISANPATFPPLVANVQLPEGLKVTIPDLLSYAFSGGELPGEYHIFIFLTPPGAFIDGQIDSGDFLALDDQQFTFGP